MKLVATRSLILLVLLSIICISYISCKPIKNTSNPATQQTINALFEKLIATQFKYDYLTLLTNTIC